MPRPVRASDLFAGINLGLFLGWLAWSAVAMRAGYDTTGNIAEFLIYACGILAVILLSWFFLRRRPCGMGLLLLIEIGLLAHFAGAFVPFNGGRLYEAHIFGVRFDHLVHIFNAFAAAALIDHFLARPGVTARPLIVIGLVLGAGSCVEMVEYLAFLIVSDAGVGGYDNNMQDLIANLLGAASYMALGSSIGLRATARSAPPDLPPVMPVDRH